MHGNSLTREVAKETLAAMEKFGRQKDAAEFLGIAQSSLSDRLKRIRANGWHLSEGMQESMVAAKLDGMTIDGGWIITDKDGEIIKRSTRYSKKDDGEKESIRDVIQDAIKDLDRLPVIDAPTRVESEINNIIPLADLHFGGEYGRASYETECCDTMDRLFSSLARGQRATIIDLGDTTDANDHLGVTPASKNPCDVIRHGMLGTIWTALRFLKHVTYRALETHQEVEVHVLRGNHSETSYIGVLLALMEHFADNPRVTVVIPPAEGPESMFRIIQWGDCGILADHGDKMKWSVLRDIWTTAFAESWTASRAYRGIYTAHFHSDRQQDLAGVEGRQFRTMSAPSHWAKERFPPMPRSASAISLHKWEGFDGMIQKKLRPIA